MAIIKHRRSDEPGRIPALDQLVLGELAINTYDGNIYTKVEREGVEEIIKYKCKICNISSWNGNEISLQLDHINGVNNDNRLENLRFLCPNCHSQTSTWGSKNNNHN